MGAHQSFNPSCFETVIVLAVVGVAAWYLFGGLVRSLFRGVVDIGLSPDKNDDLLDVPLEEGDLCPDCGEGVLSAVEIEREPGELQLKKYALKCSNCKKQFRSD